MTTINEKFVKSIAALTFVVSLKSSEDYAGRLENNAAYEIYVHLYDKLTCCDSFDAFFAVNSETKQWMDEILIKVRENSAYNEANRIPNLHLLGECVQYLLAPRFVKETKPDPNMKRCEHIVRWFESNAGLDADTDTDIVHAGFLAMFHI